MHGRRFAFERWPFGADLLLIALAQSVLIDLHGSRGSVAKVPVTEGQEIASRLTPQTGDLTDKCMNSVDKVKRHIDLHQGSVSVTSAQGPGTTVTIRLPA